jgi:hypothetical protein
MKLKWTLILCLFLLTTIVNGQYYSKTTIKTNILNPYGIALETPLYKRLSIDVGIRKFEYDNRRLFGKYEVNNKWIQFNYHFARFNPKKVNSAYIYSGIQYFRKNIILIDGNDFYFKHTYEAFRHPLGLGIKTRVVTLWCGVELAFSEKKNIIQYINNRSGHIVSENPWKRTGMFLNFGLGINLVNF